MSAARWGWVAGGMWAAMLALVLGLGGYVIAHNAHQVNRTANATVAICQTSNEDRALNERLWTEVIAILVRTSPPTTPQAHAEVAAVQHLVTEAFAPRHCPKP